jgi:hypothetical protein
MISLMFLSNKNYLIDNILTRSVTELSTEKHKV